MVTYIGDKNGECGLCKTIMVRRCSLIKHIVTVHKVLNKLLNFEEDAMLEGKNCPFTQCSSTYSQKRYLLAHLARTHYRQEMEALIGKGKWQCGLCQMTCSSEHDLMGHLANFHQAIKKLIQSLKLAKSKFDPESIS